MRLIRNLAVAAAVALMPGAALAQERYPGREIMRPLVLEYLMVEAGMGFMWLNTDRAFDRGGGLDDIYGDYTEMVAELELAFGLTENLQISVGIPYIYREFDYSGSMAEPLSGPISLGGGDASVEGFGDLDATVLLQIYRQTVGRPTSVVIGVRGIFPIGESDLDWSNLSLGPPSRGAYAVGPIFMVKETYWNNICLLTSFEWDFYFEGEQKFLDKTVDTDYGNILKVGLEPILQVSDHMALWLSIFYTKWYESEIEENDSYTHKIEDASLLEVRPAVELQLGSHFDIFVGTSWKAMGENVPGGWPVWGELEIRF